MDHPFMQVGNALTAALLCSPLHEIISKDTMLISVTGQKSGRKFSLPVNYFQYGDILYITSLRSCAWWRNLRGGVPVTVRLEGREVNGSGALIEKSTDILQDLKQFFNILPEAARFFGIRLDPMNHPNRRDIFWLAQERVLIKVCLNQKISTT
jgi:hypothetical protein